MGLAVQPFEIAALLAILCDEADAAPVLNAAAHLARRFGARLAAFAVGAATDPFVPSGDFGMSLNQAYLERMQQDTAAKLAKLRAAFDVAMAALNHGAVTRDTEWLEPSGTSATYLATQGRLYDLLLLARPPGRGSAELDIMLETALFETGRPVLAIPRSYSGAIAEHILVAWNGSTESARSIALSLPLLKAAQSVTVISAEGAQVSGPTAAELARSLAWHGIAATHQHFPEAATAVQAGALFLSEAERRGADLIIKGAYTQSRLRQLVFGGATRHLINNATIPLLLVH